jgi:ApaG protein
MEQYPINISVETAYLKEQSDTENKRYVFSYHITITNHCDEPVQLLSRHWMITDGNHKVQEVQGQGVIGEQPSIPCAASYDYTSGTVLATEVGSMTGYYEMQTASGKLFSAPIPTFTLALPNALH